MGVDLGDLAVKHVISLESLNGRVIAIDAFNTLYQFLASIRQEDGTPLQDFKGRITAHLSGLFYRTAKLVENGIRPVFVFDGTPPKFKRRTSEQRAKNKQEAEEKWRKALEEERFDDAKKFAQATSRLTEEMVVESKELLIAIGIPYVQAPSEGEAQASTMVRQGVAYATGSQDYDSLLFGSPILIRNINITGRRKIPRQNRHILIEPEEIRLAETLGILGITREKLIMMGMLIGTDFNEGVKGVGPKTALKIVKDIKTLRDLENYLYEKYHYEFEADINEIYEFFTNPPSIQLEKRLGWGTMSREKIEQLLVKEHDFSEERITRTIEAMEKSFRERGAQSKLGEWI